MSRFAYKGPAPDAPPPSAISASAPPAESTLRPEAGTLARGVWEAPAWAFYAALPVVLVPPLLLFARRAGLLRSRRHPRR